MEYNIAAIPPSIVCARRASSYHFKNTEIQKNNNFMFIIIISNVIPTVL